MEQQPSIPSQEQEIDLIELALKIWKERRFILKVCGIGAIIGLIVAFSIPKEYKTEVKLSPENAEGNKVGQLNGLAAMAGINLRGSSGSDALGVDLYPEIVSSTPFLLELVDVPVETKDGKLMVSFYKYMTEYQKSSWWSYLRSAPFKVLGWGMSLFKKERGEDDGKINAFKLTKKQEDFIIGLKERVTVGVDKKTGVITAFVIMQDPLISATLMDTILTNLQTYITDYRTRKAKYDLVFSNKLYDEAKDTYYKIQKMYATYVDANKNVVSASFKTEEERLRNEMNLAYGVYNQMAQQLEVNKIKVQEVTPVYTVIEPARMAIGAIKPNKFMLLVAFIFLSGLVSIGWVMMKSIFAEKFHIRKN